MRRHIPGLHLPQQTVQRHLDGLFLVHVDRAFYRWQPKKPFLELQFRVVEPTSLQSQSFHSRLYCSERALWKLNWFLRDFGYDRDLLNTDNIDEKALKGLRGVVRVSHVVLNGRSYQNLDAFAPASEWECVSIAAVSTAGAQ
jgi:hypothetical protein